MTTLEKEGKNNQVVYRVYCTRFRTRIPVSSPTYSVIFHSVGYSTFRTPACPQNELRNACEILTWSDYRVLKRSLRL